MPDSNDRSYLIFTIANPHEPFIICRRTFQPSLHDALNHVSAMLFPGRTFCVMLEADYEAHSRQDMGKWRLSYNSLIACDRCENRVCEQPDGKCLHARARKEWTPCPRTILDDITRRTNEHSGH